MRRTMIRAVLPAVLVSALGLHTPAAEAVSATAVTFTGVVTTAQPLTLTTINTDITFTTTTCLEEAVNVGKPKPLATTGSCKITAKGGYTGSCVFGLGTVSGTYTDSIGQTYLVFLAFRVTYPTWTPLANFVKGPQFGTGAGEGTWLPDVVQCAGPGVTTVPVTAQFAYELT